MKIKIPISKSRCALKSLDDELKRLRRMSVEDKIKAALSMGDKFSWLKPAATKSEAIQGNKRDTGTDRQIF